MLIPIRCFTCGKVTGDKWYTYLNMVNKKKIENGVEDDNNTLYIKDDNIHKSIEGEVLDELGMNRYCCRRIFLSNTNIIDEI